MSETVISPDSREEALHSGHHPDLQHHFDDMEQQKEASSLGMWVFLAQEIMFFGGLFLLYLIYRMNYYPIFAMASRRSAYPPLPTPAAAAAYIAAPTADACGTGDASTS